MKKFILIVTAILLSTGAYAQHFEHGIKGGLNQAYYTDDSNNSSGSRAGIHIGVVGEYVINRNIGVQMELLYSMQGGKYTYDGARYSEKLDYITFPILAKIYFSYSRRWSVDLGPQFGYMVSAKVKVNEGGYSWSENFYDATNLNKFDASLCFGISYKFDSGIDISIRGVAGLTDIINNGGLRNNVSQISIGYRF